MGETTKFSSSSTGSSWNVDTLHQHFVKLLSEKEERDVERFGAQKELSEASMDAANRAVLKAEMASERRFESVNEFRNTLADQQRNLMPRAEAELWFKTLADDVRILKELNIRRTGHGEGISQGWVILVGFLGLVGTVLGIVAALRAF